MRNQCLDLAVALKEQISHFPISQGDYFINENLDIFDNRNKKPLSEYKEGTAYFFIPNKGLLKINVDRIRAFISNGLTEGMVNFLDRRYRVTGTKGDLRFISYQLFYQLPSLNNLEKIRKEHPELNNKEGFFDEGIIEYKEKPGFYFVPTTNATLVVNPRTLQFFNTYNYIELTPQLHKNGYFHITLNKRLCNKYSIPLHRALAFVTINLPSRFRISGKSITECVKDLHVDHKDGDVSNNNISNLQYLTGIENMDKSMDQNKNPRLWRTLWRSPDGEILEFRSIKKAGEMIGVSSAKLWWFFTHWRLSTKEINGWTLLTERPKCKYDNFYTFFEMRGVSRYSITSFKDGIAAINIKTKETILLNNVDEFLDMTNIKPSFFEGRIANKGPLSEVAGFICFPIKYMSLLSSSGFLDNI